MNRLILLLVPVWLAAAITGAVVDGLFWLTVVGVVLFLASLGTLSSRLRRRRVLMGPVLHQTAGEPAPPTRIPASSGARS